MKHLLISLFIILNLLSSEVFAQQMGATTPVISGRNITPYDCSGTLTTGGTAQYVIPTTGSANTNTPNVRGITIMNLDTTEPLWIDFTGAAVVGQSYALAAGTASTLVNSGSFTSPVGFGLNKNVSVNAATTGHRWKCTYY